MDWDFFEEHNKEISNDLTVKEYCVLLSMISLGSIMLVVLACQIYYLTQII